MVDRNEIKKALQVSNEQFHDTQNTPRNQIPSIDGIAFNVNHQFHESIATKTKKLKLPDDGLAQFVEMFIGEKELIREEFLLKVETLERENVQLRSNQADLARQVCCLLKKNEINFDEDEFDLTSDGRTFNELISNKLVTFKNINKLQENNQMLLMIVRELISLENTQKMLDLESYVAKVVNYRKKWCQRAEQFQQVSRVLIEKLLEENTALRKVNAIMNDIVESGSIHASYKDKKISALSQNLQKLKQQFVSLKIEYLRCCDQNKEDINLLNQEIYIMRQEATKLTENNRKLIAQVRIKNYKISSCSKQIESLEKAMQTIIAYNVDITNEVNIKQAKIASCLEQIQSLKQDIQTITQHNTEEINTKQTNISSYLEQIQSLKRLIQTIVRNNVDVTEQLKLKEAKNVNCSKKIAFLEKEIQTITQHNIEEENIKTKISNYLEKIQSLEKQNETITEQVVNLTEELKIKDAGYATFLKQIKALDEDHNTVKKHNEYLTNELASFQKAGGTFHSGGSKRSSDEKRESPILNKKSKSLRTTNIIGILENENFLLQKIYLHRYGEDCATLFITSINSDFQSTVYPVNIIQPCCLNYKESTQFSADIIESNGNSGTEQGEILGLESRPRSKTHPYFLRENRIKKKFLD